MDALGAPLRTVADPADSHCSVRQVEGAGRIYGERDTLYVHGAWMLRVGGVMILS